MEQDLLGGLKVPQAACFGIHTVRDVYPTALRVAAFGLVLELSDSLAALQTELQQHETEFAGIFELGRTEMQDAVPMRLRQLELKAFLPLIAHNLLHSLEMLINVVNLFATHCIQRIQANVDRCRQWLEESHAFITALTPYPGYDAAADPTKLALREGKQLKQVLLASGLFTEEEFNAVFTPGQLTRPGVAGTEFLKKGGNRSEGHS